MGAEEWGAMSVVQKRAPVGGERGSVEVRAGRGTWLEAGMVSVLWLGWVSWC